MALTKIGKDLVEMLRFLKDNGNFEDKAVMPVMVMVKTDEMKMKLMEYMFAVTENGEELTQEMVVKEACRIFDEMGDKNDINYTIGVPEEGCGCHEHHNHSHNECLSNDCLSNDCCDGECNGGCLS